MVQYIGEKKSVFGGDLMCNGNVMWIKRNIELD